MTDQKHRRTRDDRPDPDEKSTFAEGQTREEHHPDRTPAGDFDRGGQQEHEGTFAEGQAEKLPRPEDTPPGDFARGERVVSEYPGDEDAVRDESTRRDAARGSRDRDD